MPHRIHELKGLLGRGEKALLGSISTTMCREFGERLGGRDIYPDQDNRWGGGVRAWTLQYCSV